MKPTRPVSLALRGLFGLFVAFAAVVALIGPASAQDDGGLAITGTGFDADIAVRGLGTDLNAAVDPRVAIYYDGVPATRSTQPRWSG